MTKNYYKGAMGIVLVFSLTEKETFDNISKWIKDIKDNKGDDISLIILGNKSDLRDQREVSEESILQFT